MADFLRLPNKNELIWIVLRISSKPTEYYGRRKVFILVLLWIEQENLRKKISESSFVR